MLRIGQLTIRYGARVLLQQAELSVGSGHRVGLVGRNGTGKTTLLRAMVGELAVDEGHIDMPSRWRVGLSRQEAPGGEGSLIDTVLAADIELATLAREAETCVDPAEIATLHERLRDKDAHTARSRAARILAGLGFDEAAQQRGCSTFSGGWRMRVALAGLLFTAPDLLLLDEPTNHLDLEATLWLEDYLRQYPGTMLIVSHDRGLLNRVCEEIVHLDGGKLTLYSGNYDRFEATRRMRLELNEKLRVKQEAQRAHLQSFVDRFRYKASKAKQAQSRLKMLARLQPMLSAQEEGGTSFEFPEPDPLPPPLLVLDGVSVGYDQTPVLRGLSLRLDQDDRVALLGANGNGKSTLVKLLAGRLAPLAGRVQKSGKLRIGYFAQHQADELDLAATPLLELQRRRPRDTETQVRAHLGQFGFSQQRAETKIGSLSGGEKARLLFALMSSAKPHILLLDEPTNHLDISAREALIQSINAFQGAVVLVSHDPHVVELVADRFWLVENGRVGTYDGDMEDYRQFSLSRRGEQGEARARKPDDDSLHAQRKEHKRLAALRRAALAPLKKRLGQAEREVERLEAERTRLTEAMIEPALYQGDSGRIVGLQTELGRLTRALETAEQEWMSLQEEYDAAMLAAEPNAAGDDAR